ncbi:MAG: VanW family protein [Oscillospiraceae bacterium]
MRKLKDVDMWLQENKIINLKIACKQINLITIKPGEIFSYWNLIGKPSKRKGYVKGMILSNGTFQAGIGGGLCQLSNLLFWMTIHTPLTVIERHRHGYDVFPDSNRTQPFGSGATCFYPHGDLMIQNNTQDTYQLVVKVGDKFLEGEWRTFSKPQYYYKIVERNHKMQGEYWGGYSRQNEIYQQKYNAKDELEDEVLVVKNQAIMMYSPFLESGR